MAITIPSKAATVAHTTKKLNATDTQGDYLGNELLQRVEKEGGIIIERGEFVIGRQNPINIATLGEVIVVGVPLEIKVGNGTVTVSVSDKETISRMILSTNDPVGSLKNRGLKLTARYKQGIKGEHITIEPFFRDGIRVIVYPKPPSRK